MRLTVRRAGKSAASSRTLDVFGGKQG